ncbi:MAG: carbohydrate ABC transporter substrate-binding protein [Clostridiales bacterium]|nr:carbohydrate ABC transporter substrate-binding protein [Clostridiales bacterium]
MKRVVSLLLVLALVLSMVACGNNNDANNNASTNTGTNENTSSTEVEEQETGIEATISVQVESSWLEYYEAAKARVLENNPDATINFIETGSFDHLNVLDDTDVTNADVADVFALPADRIYGLAQNEALATLDAKGMASVVGGFADYDAGLGGNFNVNGDYLAFPMNIETLIIFANSANAEANGINLEETIEFTELNYEDMLVPAFNAWFGVALTNAASVELLGQNEDGSLFSDLTMEYADLPKEKQELFTALFNFWKAHDEKATDAWDKDATWGYMDSAFTTGGTNSLRLEGPWSTAGLAEKAGNGEDLAILPINQVTINGMPLAHWKGGWGLAVNARVEGNVDQMKLAEAMIEEIVNTDYAVDLFKATGKILENVDPAVYTDSDLSEQDKKVVDAVIESYQDAPARPLFTEWGQVWGTWENAVLSWSAVKPATVEDAYAELKAAFDAMMSNF